MSRRSRTTRRARLRRRLGAILMAGGTALALVGPLDGTAHAHAKVIKLKLTKAAINAPAGSAFTFTVTCVHDTNPTRYVNPGPWTLTYPTDFTAGEVTLSGIYEFSTCTVTEADPGALWTTTVNGTTGRTVGLATGRGAKTLTAAFENRYPFTGPLEVDKSVVGPGAGPFTVRAVCTYLQLTVLDETFTLDDGDSRRFDGIPIGATCVVSETDTAGAASTTTVPPTTTTVPPATTTTVAVLGLVETPPPPVAAPEPAPVELPRSGGALHLVAAVALVLTGAGLWVSGRPRQGS